MWSTTRPPPCARRCHQAETAQFEQSRHGLPAWVAFAGTDGLTPAQMAQYQSIPEGQFSPSKARNAIGAMEGPEITQFACETCHAVGKPRRMDRLASARNATCATSSAWNRRASPKPATPATSARTIRSGRSTRNRRTASPT